MKRFLLIFGLFPAITFAAPIIVRPAPVRIPAKPAPARPAKPAHSDNSAVVPIAAIVATQNIRTQNRNIGGTTCLVVKVSDGDTFSCNKGYDNIIQVRLADIDAPESGQAYGNQARKALNKLIYKQAVTLKNERKDKYGRTVATVFSGSTNVNLTMIEQGYAWHYDRYSNNAEYAAAMRQAQAKKRGLWADKGKIIKPEQWRHR
ncbi:MAG: thermonuclease family protein [Neisseriaceae bacterium]|nr:thermonuclease family protein [Neisseriaceae bacterium]